MWQLGLQATQTFIRVSIIGLPTWSSRFQVGTLIKASFLETFWAAGGASTAPLPVTRPWVQCLCTASAHSGYRERVLSAFAQAPSLDLRFIDHGLPIPVTVRCLRDQGRFCVSESPSAVVLKMRRTRLHRYRAVARAALPPTNTSKNMYWILLPSEYACLRAICVELAAIRVPAKRTRASK